MGVYEMLLEGSTNGLHLRELAQITGLSEREVRSLIHAERRKGYPILSDNRSGYFKSSSDEERAACVRSLRHRATEILAAAAAIENAE